MKVWIFWVVIMVVLPVLALKIRTDMKSLTLLAMDRSLNSQMFFILREAALTLLILTVTITPSLSKMLP